MKMEVQVNVEEGNILIFEDNNYIVGWSETEWIEDPSVVYSIMNGIELAHNNPEKLKELLNGLSGDTLKVNI